MKPRIDMIGVITSQFDKMVAFYIDVLGFKIKTKMDQYVEFENEGVRFAISTNKVMRDVTKHTSYNEKKKGQSLELAFRVDNVADVDKVFNDIVKKGAREITSPENMPWGQRAAFFADPDGNIHELFSDL